MFRCFRSILSLDHGIGDFRHFLCDSVDLERNDLIRQCIPMLDHVDFLLRLLACLKLLEDFLDEGSCQRVALEISSDLACLDILQACGASVEGDQDDVGAGAVLDAGIVHRGHAGRLPR